MDKSQFVKPTKQKFTDRFDKIDFEGFVPDLHKLIIIFLNLPDTCSKLSQLS